MSKLLENVGDRHPKIQKFLEKIYKKLPEWLKEKEEECEEILQEMEDHILDKVEEMEQNPKYIAAELIRDDLIRKAITTMGEPEEISREYKKRGVPKIYISEELYPYYIMTLQIFLGVVSVLIIIGNALAANVTFKSFMLGFTEGFFIALMVDFVLATGIWTALSMEGYLPEDMGIEEKTVLVKGKAVIKRSYSEPKKGHKKKKEPIIPAEFAAGGFITILFGFLFVIQPWQGINDLFNEEYLVYIRYGGYITIIDGFLYFARAFAGRTNIEAHQVILSGFFFTQIGNIYINWLVIQNPSCLEWNMFIVPLWVAQLFFFFNIIGLFDKIHKVVEVRKQINDYYN